MKLYHYTKYDTLVKYILPTMKLKLSSLSNTNDPAEGSPKFVYAEVNPILYNMEQDSEQPKAVYFSEYQKYKFISLCGNKNGIEGWKISSMWAHYANNHEGVCIEIDTDRLAIPQTINGDWVNYDISLPPPFTRNQNIMQYIKENVKHIFFTKAIEWQYEQEYRFISKDDKYMDISNTITAIYCGCRMCETSLQRVKSFGYRTIRLTPSLISRKLSINGIM